MDQVSQATPSRRCSRDRAHVFLFRQASNLCSHSRAATCQYVLVLPDLEVRDRLFERLCPGGWTMTEPLLRASMNRILFRMLFGKQLADVREEGEDSEDEKSVEETKKSR